MSVTLLAGEEALPGSELPEEWAGGERYPADQRGTNPHGLQARDPVQ